MIIRLFFLLLCTTFSLSAAYTIKDGKIIHKDEVATMSVQEHFSAASDALQREDWEELAFQAKVVVKSFPDTPFAGEAYYMLGLALFNLGDYEYANASFSEYLRVELSPKHFDEAINYKFAIAEKFREGARRHVLGWEKLPQWHPAQEEAVAIYDQVIMAFPHHDLAARALFGKAQVLFALEEYKQSIETYQTLIRRFPKHPLTPESYEKIGFVYLTECQVRFPDPDFLDLAMINLRKFKQDFPSEERIGAVQQMIVDMQEVYAQTLYETGQFYERTKKPTAALIYYNKIMAKYPETQSASLSQTRVEKIQATLDKK